MTHAYYIHSLPYSSQPASTMTTTVGNGRCPNCGKPYWYVGDWFSAAAPPICHCPTPHYWHYWHNWTAIKTTIPFVGDGFDDWRQPEEDEAWKEYQRPPAYGSFGDIDISERDIDDARAAWLERYIASLDKDESIRAAWECPRCHKVNAPHSDQCTC